MSREKPTGFVAKCRCGVYTGAMDYPRTDRRDAGKILGAWLVEGCTIEPRFGAQWQESLGQCKCLPTFTTEPDAYGNPLMSDEVAE